MARTIIQIDLPDEVFATVRAAARRRDVSPETLAGYWLEQHVNREQRGAQAAPGDDPETGLPGHGDYCWCSRCTRPVQEPPKDTDETARVARDLIMLATQMLQRAKMMLDGLETEGTPRPPKVGLTHPDDLTEAADRVTDQPPQADADEATERIAGLVKPDGEIDTTSET
ncbi:hypothetical protein BJ973_003982 [Actinoplanes tereljensis]|uniref:Uncharacterized protein n=1 Tax=Paractinoplanes tereljensis TaxID=571912 RepID=A0A919NV20_9ACTN|nr:hypothetical protein [Actinoplanes tereljensis]GIF25705.1 hypothetical protein Ate02nite_84350 [Actinoplanes tereljensis]